MFCTYEVRPFVAAGRSPSSVCILCRYVLIAGWELILVRRYVCCCVRHCRRALNIDMQTLHFVIFFHGAAAPVGQGHLFIEASRSY